VVQVAAVLVVKLLLVHQALQTQAAVVVAVVAIHKTTAELAVQA
jgi:hypothetical protein